MQRNVSPVNKLSSFINHGLIACTLLGINICSKTEIPAWILAHDNNDDQFTVVRQSSIPTQSRNNLLNQWIFIPRLTTFSGKFLFYQKTLSPELLRRLSII